MRIKSSNEIKSQSPMNTNNTNDIIINESQNSESLEQN